MAWGIWWQWWGGGGEANGRIVVRSFNSGPSVATMVGEVSGRTDACSRCNNNPCWVKEISNINNKASKVATLSNISK